MACSTYSSRRANIRIRAEVVTHDRKRGVRSFSFTYDGKYVLYPQDEGGNENFHLFGVDLTTNKETDLTPFKNARADLAQLSPKHPHEVLVNANDRNPKYFDPIHRSAHRQTHASDPERRLRRLHHRLGFQSEAGEQIDARRRQRMVQAHGGRMEIVWQSAAVATR